MVNYEHLRYFWVVAKEGSIARASERLRLTPQTISGQLGLLEDYLGTALLARVGCERGAQVHRSSPLGAGLATGGTRAYGQMT